SLYTVVTIVLAKVFLKELWRTAQRGGISLILAGIVLISL
ncbi:MAG: EamA family transporter, partial [Candidatus Tectomicrobia bacterium]|nr:EamA family transporter [Candidatus Tectomicrobia bacterium]